VKAPKSPQRLFIVNVAGAESHCPERNTVTSFAACARSRWSDAQLRVTRREPIHHSANHDTPSRVAEALAAYRQVIPAAPALPRPLKESWRVRLRLVFRKEWWRDERSDETDPAGAHPFLPGKPIAVNEPTPPAQREWRPEILTAKASQPPMVLSISGTAALQ
jgi:hypothetical protein